MTRQDALPQGKPQTFDRIFDVQRAERWCNFERAFAEFIDGVATGTIRAREREASLRGGRIHLRGSDLTDSQYKRECRD